MAAHGPPQARRLVLFCPHGCKEKRKVVNYFQLLKIRRFDANFYIFGFFAKNGKRGSAGRAIQDGEHWARDE